jgi:hypothetical protein
MDKDAEIACDPTIELSFVNIGNRPDLGDSREVGL